MTDIEVIYEEDACLVVNKASGILTQAPPGIDSVEHQVRRYLNEKGKSLSTDKSGKTYVGLPHRIDRPVSGALLFGLNKRSTKWLAGQFERRTVTKKYWALIQGNLPESHGKLADFMRKIPGEAKSEIVEESHCDAKYALLNFHVMQEVGDFTWVEIELETGRTHQIRLQFGSRGTPIVGDWMYGSKVDFGEHEPDERKRAIALHARTLHFENPTTKRKIKIEADLPGKWLQFTENQL